MKRIRRNSKKLLTDIKIYYRIGILFFEETGVRPARNYTFYQLKQLLDRDYSKVAKMINNQVKKGKRGQAIILMTPQGQPFKQSLARKLSKYKTVVLICGRYEGFDERVRDLVDMEISLGDFVLTGGEIPAMAIVDAVVRLVPGVVGKTESLVNESFSESMLEYPQYTRPEVFMGKRVPKVLLSGNHAKVKEWRQAEALKRTKKRRPDLLK